MALINFYTLLGSRHEHDDARLLVVCRICEKAVAMGHRVYVLTATEAESKRLDDLLWQFKPASFVPHAVGKSSEPQRVVLYHDPPPAEFTDVLINLSPDIISDAARYTRLNELVGPDETSLNFGRTRYRHYQAQGLQIETHKV